jgi:ABC-type nitrate/sulfonate/bicarbonate transport system permease component
MVLHDCGLGYQLQREQENENVDLLLLFVVLCCLVELIATKLQSTTKGALHRRLLFFRDKKQT